MHHIEQMLKTKKHMPEFVDIPQVAELLNQVFSCAQTCYNCADACLAEDNVKDLTRCINLNLDCADVCIATGKVLSRQSQWSQDILHHQLRACLTACELCGEECSRHADRHEHCRICADACHSCGEACKATIGALHL